MHVWESSIILLLVVGGWSTECLQLLGAGEGVDSCLAPPYRSDKVNWPHGCPLDIPCCNEFGYCKTRASWLGGEFRDCNGLSNGLGLPDEVIKLEAIFTAVKSSVDRATGPIGPIVIGGNGPIGGAGGNGGNVNNVIRRNRNREESGQGGSGGNGGNGGNGGAGGDGGNGGKGGNGGSNGGNGGSGGDGGNGGIGANGGAGGDGGAGANGGSGGNGGNGGHGGSGGNGGSVGNKDNDKGSRNSLIRPSLYDIVIDNGVNSIGIVESKNRIKASSAGNGGNGGQGGEGSDNAEGGDGGNGGKGGSGAIAGNGGHGGDGGKGGLNAAGGQGGHGGAGGDSKQSATVPVTIVPVLKTPIYHPIPGPILPIFTAVDQNILTGQGGSYNSNNRASRVIHSKPTIPITEFLV